MSQLTKIKKDFLGLYVIADGKISRPPNMDVSLTIFKKDDKVKTKHFTDTNIAGVTFENEIFQKKGYYEIWITTNIENTNYKTMSKTEIKDHTLNTFNQDFYKTKTHIYLKNNTEFKNKFKNKNYEN